MTSNVLTYYGDDEKDRKRLVQDLSAAYERASLATPATEAESLEDLAEAPTAKKERIEVEPARGLLGIDLAVYKQITGALAAGKQHLMFYGPPGTGKTTLAQYVAGVLHDNWTMITGSADWSSQDVIGGYQPIGEGNIAFVPGVLLQNFDRPLIIDELNRCDIDKVIGPLFTILSDQPTTLPYRLDSAKVSSPFYKILPRPVPKLADHEFAPKDGWRIIATINTIDKAALYQMSFALSRRFAWIYIDVPHDLQAFVYEFAKQAGLVSAEAGPSGPIPLAAMWGMLNTVRVVGAAPIIDMARTLRAMDASLDLLATPTASQAPLYLEVFSMYLTPLLDGAPRADLSSLASELFKLLRIDESSGNASTFSRRLVSLAL